METIEMKLFYQNIVMTNCLLKSFVLHVLQIWPAGLLVPAKRRTLPHQHKREKAHGWIL